MTAPTNNAAFYADFKSLAALKRDARANDPAALRAAAQQFESLFTEMMLKSMRAASFGDAVTGSDEVEFYQGMFDQQLATQMSKGKGMGLADMLVQQLTRSGLARPEAPSPAVVQSSPTTQPVNVGPQFIAPESSTTEPDIQSSEPIVDSASPTAISSSNWPPASPQEFVDTVLPHAQAAAQRLGVDPVTLVAHAALETGWGKHVPCNADGSSGFNLFGIKATPAWQGQSTGAATLEYEQGVAVKRVERFKTYASPADCFSDYAKLLAGQRYTGARNTQGDAAQFADALQQGGYATDPLYASKLRAVAGVVRSMQVDVIPVKAAQVNATAADI